MGKESRHPEFIKEIEQQFGFDKPPHKRFLFMMGNFLRFDFGDSVFRVRSVLHLVVVMLPVSFSLGLDRLCWHCLQAMKLRSLENWNKVQKSLASKAQLKLANQLRSEYTQPNKI